MREQLDSLYRAATSDPAGDPAARARSYGFLGETFLAYELVEDASAAFAEATRLDPAEPRWVYLQALAALGSGQHEAAASFFDRLLSSHSDHLPTLLRSAANLLDLGRTGEAAARYARARELVADQERTGALAAIHFGQGQIESLAGRHEEAAAHFRRVLELQPQADIVFYHLARALHRLGETDAARQALARRGQTLPTFYDPVLLAMQRRAEGPQTDLLRALRALDAGHLDQAETLFRQVLKQRPDNAEALAGLGRVHQVRGEHLQAEQAYRRSLESDGESFRVLLNLGVLLAERGDAEAADLLRRATLADPRSSAAHYNLGLQLLRRGELGPAEHALGRAVELDPEDAAALDALARSQAAQADFAAAIPTYRRLVSLAPETSGAYFALGLALTLAERCGEAASVLDRAVASFGIEGADGMARAGLLARILATCPEDAARDGSRAVELAQLLFQRSPGLETGRTLAMALAEAGRFEEAVVQARRLVDVATRGGATEAVTVLRRELDRYERGETVRSPWKQ